jgi:hypothetical protein
LAYYRPQPGGYGNATNLCHLREVAMSFISEILHFARERRKVWLLPMLILLGLFGGLLILAKGSAVAPFIYAIF